LSVIPKWLLDWMRKLLPKQEVKGDFGVQIGKAGPVTVVHNTYHVNTTVASSTDQSRVVVEQRPRQAANDDQRQVLRLMRKLPSDEKVLEFMRREFNTTRVIDLEGHQLYRVRRYVETVKSRSSLGNTNHPQVGATSKGGK